MPGELRTELGVLSLNGVKNLRMDFVFLLYVERELLKITVVSTFDLQPKADAIVDEFAVLIFIAVGLSALDFGLKSALRKIRARNSTFRNTSVGKRGATTLKNQFSCGWNG